MVNRSSIISFDPLDKNVELTLLLFKSKVQNHNYP